MSSSRGACTTMLLRFLLLLLVVGVRNGHTKVLYPPTLNVAYKRPITASATCGEVNGQPFAESYCSIAGSSEYVKNDKDMYEDSNFRELSKGEEEFKIGQYCDYCDANSTLLSHPADNMVDGTADWWQSPPISRGTQYNFINITIDLEQEFHISSVWIQMANSPRPAAWVLERSTDFGKTFIPWQYFAENSAECFRRFGLQTMKILESDDEVICTSDSSKIHPFENGEIFFTVLTDRPNERNFTHSTVLQNFARATNIRFRLLQTNTLKGHYMYMNDGYDHTLTDRYFYAIKEIYMHGRCVCNGHGASCDIEGPHNPRKYVCRCEHNTCGAQCDQCCPGFEQKKWRRSKEGQDFQCEPCNCHGHSNECVYDEEVEKNGQSLDIHGRYEGGGRCQNCRHNTQGINCNECADGFFRPPGKYWNETDVCQDFWDSQKRGDRLHKMPRELMHRSGGTTHVST
uniref:Laminin N-terminal domain-containing protein n=1 Tax=Steinernema glaseri TaxID=37863 RepID=A0A1I7Z4Z2_9BILA